MAAAHWLRENSPELKVSVVNVVDLMTLFPRKFYPHGSRQEDRAPTLISECETAIARAIPAAPSRFPCRARFGDERNRSARMKVTIVTR